MQLQWQAKVSGGERWCASAPSIFCDARREEEEEECVDHLHWKLIKSCSYQKHSPPHRRLCRSTGKFTAAPDENSPEFLAYKEMQVARYSHRTHDANMHLRRPCCASPYSGVPAVAFRTELGYRRQARLEAQEFQEKGSKALDIVKASGPWPTLTPNPIHCRPRPQRAEGDPFPTATPPYQRLRLSR